MDDADRQVYRSTTWMRFVYRLILGSVSAACSTPSPSSVNTEFTSEIELGRQTQKSAWHVDSGEEWRGLLRQGALFGDLHDLTNPLDDSTTENCVGLVDGSMDMDFRPLLGLQRVSAIMPSGTGGYPSVALFSVTAYEGSATPTKLSPIWSETLRTGALADDPEASGFPVATALSFAPMLAAAGRAPADLWESVSVLRADGVVHQFSNINIHETISNRIREDSYVLSGTIPSPALKDGEVRRYCDIETLWDGDVVLTFAATPLADTNDGVHLREGWIRYDADLKQWENPVFSYFGIDFLHPGKDGTFNRSACMSVDSGSYANKDKIVFSSNFWQNTSRSLHSLPTLWLFETTGRGIFPLLKYGQIPTSGAGYGNVEDIALIDGAHFAIHHDYDRGSSDNQDRIDFLFWRESQIFSIGTSFLPADFSSLAVYGPAEETDCSELGVLVEASTVSINRVDNHCVNLFSLTAAPCSDL